MLLLFSIPTAQGFLFQPATHTSKDTITWPALFLFRDFLRFFIFIAIFTTLCIIFHYFLELAVYSKHLQSKRIPIFTFVIAFLSWWRWRLGGQYLRPIKHKVLEWKLALVVQNSIIHWCKSKLRSVVINGGDFRSLMPFIELSLFVRRQIVIYTKD